MGSNFEFLEITEKIRANLRPIFLQLEKILNSGPTASRLPRWRGFNLLGKYSLHQQHFGPFLEWDFRMISEWGFNFVRFPMDYRLWIKDGDWRKIDPEAFRDLDQAVEWARHYGLHASLNIQGPGLLHQSTEGTQGFMDRSRTPGNLRFPLGL